MPDRGEDTTGLGGILEAVPLPTLLIDPQGVTVAANGLALTLLGDGILGRNHVLAMRQPAVLAGIEAALRDGQAAQIRYAVPHPTHEESYRVVITPVSAKGWSGVMCALVDITEQEQIAQMRRDFVANVSHELRTPLTALLGFIETLKGAAREDPAARERFLGIMEREAGRMNRLVRDLLSLSRVEAEERQRPSAQVDVAALVASAVTTLGPMATDLGVSLQITGAPGPLMVMGDQDQLTQVVHNLIENGVKYGLPGKRVTIDLAQVVKEPTLRGPAVMITVIDEGEGIDAVHLPRLTERFYRVDTHRSREKGGTGLGLAIVKHIVHRHRGRLRIESTKGQGSRFCVVLPQA